MQVEKIISLGLLVTMGSFATHSIAAENNSDSKNEIREQYQTSVNPVSTIIE